MKLLCLVTVLSLLGTGLALKCYTCKSSKPIAGITLAASALNFLNDAPPCSEFDSDNPAKKFEKECSVLLNKSCYKATDKDDPKNQVRSCYATDKQECKGQECFCNTDLCNGSAAGWPSAVVLLAALAAALVGGR